MTDSAHDSVLRAMTDDGAFRVIATCTTHTAQQAIEAQGVAGPTAGRFGEMLTGAILVRETMAPKHRVQGILYDRQGKALLVADSHPDGGARGLVTHADQALSLDDGALEMMRTLRNGELHRGVVRIPPEGGMSKALMTYMSESEQIAAAIAVGCVVEGGRVRAAGGYIVQLLPEIERSALAIMTERLSDFESIDQLLAQARGAPSTMVDELLYGMPFTKLDESEVGFRCRCSDVRVVASLATLGREEISELIAEGQLVEMSCDYCGKQYRIGPDRLKGLLQTS